MAINHTQGPWSLSYTGDKIDIDFTCFVGEFEASYPLACIDTKDIKAVDSDTCLANAKLIAAAPDLYAELRRVEVDIMQWQESEEVSGHIAAEMLARLQSVRQLITQIN